MSAPCHIAWRTSGATFENNPKCGQCCGCGDDLLKHVGTWILSLRSAILFSMRHPHVKGLRNPSASDQGMIAHCWAVVLQMAM